MATDTHLAICEDRGRPRGPAWIHSIQTQAQFTAAAIAAGTVQQQQRSPHAQHRWERGVFRTQHPAGAACACCGQVPCPPCRHPAPMPRVHQPGGEGAPHSLAEGGLLRLLDGPHRVPARHTAQLARKHPAVSPRRGFRVVGVCTAARLASSARLRLCVANPRRVFAAPGARWAEGRGQRAEGRGQRTEDRGQRAESRRSAGAAGGGRCADDAARQGAAEKGRPGCPAAAFDHVVYAANIDYQ